VTDVKQQIADDLDQVRRRSLTLLEPVPDADLVRQHSPLMSPLVWDLAHVGNYEEQWLLGRLADLRCRPQLDSIYDAFAYPRRDRPALSMLDPPEARTYVADVRGRVLDVLDRVSLDTGDPLLDGGFVYGMVVQHEHQHDETMLATLQLRGLSTPYPLDHLPAFPGPFAPSERENGRQNGKSEVLVDGGEFVMGTSSNPWAYDNERPAHVVDVPPFWIDARPVTNGQYMAFMADRGYERPELWTEAGWRWRQQASLVAPEFWRREGGDWLTNRFGTTHAVVADEPVQHVCWYEADAFARWAGRRLPTEAEWEKAAPSLSGVGQVWEWTSSDFAAYPGFRSYPYREFS